MIALTPYTWAACLHPPWWGGAWSVMNLSPEDWKIATKYLLQGQKLWLNHLKNK